MYKKLFVIAVVLVFMPLISLFSVEGVNPEPTFIEVNLDPVRENISFPMDFENLFHEPFQNYLKITNNDDHKSYYLSYSSISNIQANLNIIKKHYDFGIHFDRWANDYIDRNSIFMNSNLISLVKTNPLLTGVNISFENARYGFYKPNLFSSSLFTRYLVPLNEDCFDIRSGVKYAFRNESGKNHEVIFDISGRYQHLFSRYYGEDITISTTYMKNKYEQESKDHTKIALNAAFFYHRDVYLLKAGLFSATSSDVSIGSPYIESRIDTHKLKFVAIYSANLIIPEMNILLSNRPEIRYDTTLPIGKSRSFSAEGMYRFNKENDLKIRANYSHIENSIYYTSEVLGGTSDYTFEMADIRKIELDIIAKNRYKYITNTLNCNLRRHSQLKEKMYIPHVPLIEITNNITIDLSDLLQCNLLLGYRDAFHRKLYWYTDSDPDIEKSFLLDLGLLYSVGDYTFSLGFENIVDDVYDDMGYKHPLTIRLGFVNGN